MCPLNVMSRTASRFEIRAMHPLSLPEYEFILKRDFLSFAVRAFYELNAHTELLMSWYIELLAAKLDACRRGEITRLIVNIPPRYLKSHLASIALPAWYLGHYPSRHVITACYGQDLSETFARQCRALMLTPWYERLFRTRLSDRLAVHDFSTTELGTRLATSVNGPLTGRGADLIIIDDPIKPEDALSQSRRSTTNQWYDGVLLSRLNNKMTGCIIIVMQRLHQDDLVGHVLEQDNWEIVSLPAIAQQDERYVISTPFGRREHVFRAGTALHPEREPLQALLRTRERIGPFFFSSQYLQTPIPKDGNLVKPEWFGSYEPGAEPARFDRKLQSWDTANKAEEFNDFSVCTTWGQHGKYFYLLDVYRAKLEYPELKRKVIDLAQRHGAETVLIEDKASGTQLIQDVRNSFYGVTAYEPPKGADKQVRLHVQTPIFEQGFVLLPSQAPWLQDYIAEITGFPGTRYDDQVDSTTQALAYMRESNDMEIWKKLGEGPNFPPMTLSPLGFPLRRRF